MRLPEQPNVLVSFASCRTIRPLPHSRSSVSAWTVNGAIEKALTGL